MANELGRPTWKSKRCTCGGKSKVVDNDEVQNIEIRRRECRRCRSRWTTFESTIDPRRIRQRAS